MNKKEVKELIGNAKEYILTYQKSKKIVDISLAFLNLQRAERELNKSDWVSVKDELPPYDQNVEVRNIAYPNMVWTASRHQTIKDNYGFVIQLWRKGITHWKFIDKLEE